MITKATKGLQMAKGVLLAALCMFGLNAHTEFKKLDQPFVFFKSADGFKFPYMMVCNPGLNQWNMVLCGTVKNGQPRLFKRAQDLENMLPLRSILKFADSGTQIDKKYRGFREANITILLELFFRSVGLISNDGYAGKVLIDEYKAGLPMKWVLGSIEHFRAIRNYMIKELSVLATTAFPLKKPLLMVEFLDGKSAFSDDDKRFLDTCFDLLDSNDAEACAFFERAQTKLGDVMDMTSSAKRVKESLGELFMNRVEDFSSLEANKMILATGAIVTFFFMAKPLADWIQKWVGSYDIVHVLHLPEPAVRR
jgi:hypothetical protein